MTRQPQPKPSSQPKGAKPARQARSRATTQAIVSALEMLLAEKSFDEITMAELAKAAGISPGAIYRRFENKNALLPHVFARYGEELENWLGRVTAQRLLADEPPIEEALRRVISETLRCFRANAHIFRTVHLYGRLNSVDAPGSGANPDFEPLASILKAYEDELSRRPREAAAFLGHVLISGVTERALYPEQLPARGLRISDKRFIEDMAEMFAAWIRFCQTKER